MYGTGERDQPHPILNAVDVLTLHVTRDQYISLLQGVLIYYNTLAYLHLSVGINLDGELKVVDVGKHIAIEAHPDKEPVICGTVQCHVYTEIVLGIEKHSNRGDTCTLNK